MFETSVVRSRTSAAPRRFGLLSASLVIHTAAIIGAVGLSIASVEFPREAPAQTTIFRPVSLPPALGDGREPGPKPKPVTKTEAPKQAVLPPPVRGVAPTSAQEPATITNATTVDPGAESSDVTDGAGRGGTEPGTGQGTGGSPLGEPHGVGDGTGGLPGTGQAPLIPGGEVRAARVVRRVDPRYPQTMIAARIRTAVVTVRCVIDRHGRIRSPEVVTSSYAPFNHAVLEAMERWTFAPGTMRGQPVDTWFELTVRFEVR